MSSCDSSISAGIQSLPPWKLPTARPKPSPLLSLSPKVCLEKFANLLQNYLTIYNIDQSLIYSKAPIYQASWTKGIRSTVNRGTIYIDSHKELVIGGEDWGLVNWETRFKIGAHGKLEFYCIGLRSQFLALNTLYHVHVFKNLLISWNSYALTTEVKYSSKLRDIFEF